MRQRLWRRRVGWGSGWEDGTIWSAGSPLTFGGAAFLSGYDELVKKITESPHLPLVTVSINFQLPNVSGASPFLRLQGHHPGAQPHRPIWTLTPQPTGGPLCPGPWPSHSACSWQPDHSSKTQIRLGPTPA